MEENKMMSTLRHILLLLLLLVAASAFSQAVKTDFDKKIIITDSLNLPGNINASTVINLLPELLQRPGDYILSNYDVKIEGMSVGSAADVALLQIQLIDIEKIEVNESALSSYQKNGQGGSINLVLRSAGKSPDHHFWGSVGLHGSTYRDVGQSAILGYKKGKLMVRGIVLGEITNARRDVGTLVYEDGNLVSETNVTTQGRFRTQLARAYLRYNFTKRDELKFAVSEVYSYYKNTNVTDMNVENSKIGISKGFNVLANMSYKHTTPRGSFSTSIDYSHKPSRNNSQAADILLRNKKVGNVISGKVEYKATLFNSVNALGRKRFGELTMGVNFNASLGSEEEYLDRKTMTTLQTKDMPQNDTYYVMPNATFNTTLGRLRLKASGGFQYFSYKIDLSNNSHSSVSKDLTGKLMAEWLFTDMRKIRFILDRKLKRPSATQLYPFLTMNSDQTIYIEGNTDLKPMMVHEAMFSYIDTYNLGKGHQLVLNSDISISSITDIITEQKSTRPDPTDENSKANYITYINRGSNTVSSANLMALYTYKAFSLSFTGNIYHKELGADSNNDYYTYYNLSLYPSFRHKRSGWNGGVRFAYFSNINQLNSSLGNCAVTDVIVGKSFNRFYIYLSKCFSFSKNSTDVTTTGNQRKERKYEMVATYTGIGVKYSF